MINYLNKFINKSIKRHLIIGIVITHAILMSIFIYDMTSNQEKFLIDESISQTKSLAINLSKTSVTSVLSNDYVGMEEIIDSMKSYPHLKYAMLTNLEGKILAHSDKKYLNLYLNDEKSSELLLNDELIILINNPAILDIAAPIFTNSIQVGWARVGINQDHINKGTAYLTIKGFIYAFIAILIGWAFAVFMANRLTKSIFQISDLAKNITSGNIKKRLLISREDELGELMSQFNIMLDNLEKKDDEINKINTSLKESEFKWKFAIEGNGAGLWDWNMITNEVYFSPQWKKMLGFNVDEIKGSLEEWENRVHKDDLKNTYKDIKKHINGETEYYQNEHRVLCKDGTYKWILDRGVIVNRLEDGTPKRMIGTHIDITPIKNLSENLRKNNEKLDLATKSGNLGVWSWDIYKDILEWNEQMYEIYDVENDSKNLPYDVWKNSLHDDDKERAEKELLLALNNRSKFDTVFKIKTVKNNIKYIKATGIVDFINNEAIYMIGTNQDITEKVKYEEELITQKNLSEESKQEAIYLKDLAESQKSVLAYERERAMQALEEAKVSEEEAIAAQEEMLIVQENLRYANEAKSEFLANMSHEIRTPLAGIIGITDILLDEVKSSNVKDNLQIIKNSSVTLKNIINDVLDFSKIQSGKFQITLREFSLREMMNDIEALFKPQITSKGIDFTLKIEENVFDSLLGDSLRIHQIFNNLIGNSVKFTQKGQIQIHVKKLYEDDNRTRLEFIIKDTGIGIEDKIKNKIFESFTQGELSNTKSYQGTGLGLAITKSLIDLMNGKVRFMSAVGVGTTFYFNLDFKKVNEIHEEKIDVINSEGLFLGKKALVVEDSEINQLVAKKILSKMGFEVSIANDGEEGVDAVKKHNYDIVYMDIQMPNMDGYEATQLIRTFNKDIPIIALSAAVQDIDKKNSIEAGMNDHLKKPIEKDELVQTTLKYVHIDKIFNIDVQEENEIREELNENSNLSSIEKIFNDLSSEYGEDVAKTLLETFYEQYHNIKDDIKDIDNEQLRKYVHKLKGSSGSLKINDIHELCVLIEEKDLDAKLIDKLVLKIDNLFEGIKLCLKF